MNTVRTVRNVFLLFSLILQIAKKTVNVWWVCFSSLTNCWLCFIAEIFGYLYPKLIQATSLPSMGFTPHFFHSLRFFIFFHIHSVHWRNPFVGIINTPLIDFKKIYLHVRNRTHTHTDRSPKGSERVSEKARKRCQSSHIHKFNCIFVLHATKRHTEGQIPLRFFQLLDCRFILTCTHIDLVWWYPNT